MIVPDIEEAMASYTGAFGHTWSAVRDRSRPVTTEQGTTDVQLRVVFSVEGPTHLELIEQAPGTPWEGPLGLHHFGYWADDVRAESARLLALGFPLIFSVRPDGTHGAWRVAFHRAPGSTTCVELVASNVRAEFQARLAGRAV